jgi:hypothetical protein
VARSTSGRTGRAVVIALCTLVVLGLFGAVVRQSWVTNAQAADVVRLESQGVEVLHPLTTLLAELVAAQSAAVGGRPVAADRLRNALAEVSEANQEFGAGLQAPQRLADLTAQVDAAIGRREVGRPAYDSFSVLVTLAVALIRQVGDTSHLVHDPDLDSYYLMDAAIVRLPSAMVFAGRASDLVTLASGQALEGEDAVKAAVARFGVSDAAEEVSAGLTKSVDFTANPALGANITERLDAFKTAADAFAPPTMLVELHGAVDPGTLAANALKVTATANPLAHRLLGQLAVLLEERAAKLEASWRFTAVAGGVAAAFALLILWFIAMPRQRAALADAADDAAPRHARDDVPVSSISYARDLLDTERVVHVGRAVRPRTREPDDAR